MSNCALDLGVGDLGAWCITPKHLNKPHTPHHLTPKHLNEPHPPQHLTPKHAPK
jgi:hypothetical protein